MVTFLTLDERTGKVSYMSFASNEEMKALVESQPLGTFVSFGDYNPNTLWIKKSGEWETVNDGPHDTASDHTISRMLRTDSPWSFS